jgi:hypothetical protein
MGAKASIFEYMYRDGGNFKTHGRLLLSGHDVAAEQEVMRSLDWDNQFVAEQVGIPSLCREHWESVGEGPSDLDHAYHEFICLRAASGEDVGLPVWGAVETLVGRMLAAADKWDVRLSPNCDL